LLLTGILSVALGVLSGGIATLGSTLTNHVAGWVGVVFFGGGGLFVVWRAITSGRDGVRLSREGFSVVMGRRTTLYRWAEVLDFRVVRIGSSFVGFDLTDDARRTGIVKAGRAMSGVDAILPNPLIVNPSELASLMNAWRSHYASHAG
jgi:hypothetical protein